MKDFKAVLPIYASGFSGKRTVNSRVFTESEIAKISWKIGTDGHPQLGVKPDVITYSYINALPTYYQVSGSSTQQERTDLRKWLLDTFFQGSFSQSSNGSYQLSNVQVYGFDLDQIKATEGIIASIKSVVDIDLQPETNSIGKITFANTNIDPPGAGSTFFVNWGSHASTSGEKIGGDVWIDRNTVMSHPGTWDAGELCYWIVLHEIGHALGLGHTYFTEDQHPDFTMRDTIMSYNPAKDSEIPNSVYFVYPSTLMPMDIAALQHLYGANTTTTNGKNIYGVGGTGDWAWGTKPFFRTIWDAGLNDSDLIDCSDQTGRCIIDLRAGAYSSIGIIENAPTDSYNGRNNLAIAYDYHGVDGTVVKVVIENAIGGSNNDTILGNDADNTISGGNGTGTTDGNDILAGGDGYDTYEFVGNFGKDIVGDSDSKGVILLDGKPLGAARLAVGADKAPSATWVIDRDNGQKVFVQMLKNSGASYT
jgi:hypothetical protein